MDMKTIIKELEAKLQNINSQVEKWEGQRKLWAAAVEKADEALKTLNNNKDNIEMMIEAAKSVKDMKRSGIYELDAITNVVSEPTEVDNKTGEETENNKRHRGARVLKLNEYHNVVDRFKSQKEASKILKWDQSSISKFMKLSREEQLKRKGFELVWEY